MLLVQLPGVTEGLRPSSGRTGRSGHSSAISFSDHEEKSLLRNVQKLIDKDILKIQKILFL